ncbi:MAG TPA: hypothetical protein VGT40_01105 [Methylomirabilota bacterium]|nr:hypothetical protein [Methylomirabilota bacterium]
MLDLTFLLGGREITTHDLESPVVDGSERIMLLAVRNHMRRRLGNFSCLRHGQRPRVVVVGPSADRLTFSVEGCCRELVEDAREVLEVARPSGLPLAS